MTERVSITGAKGKFSAIQRSLPRKRPSDCRTGAEYALAATMLLKLRRGEDVRREKVRAMQEGIFHGLVDTDAKLDRALDRLIDDLESVP